jgi:hypothetical protein
MFFGSPTRVREIALALRKTTELLGRELAFPTPVAPVWSEFEWRIAQAVLAMQGTSSLFSSRSRWVGPDSWQHFLRQQRHHTAARHGMIVHLLNEIDLRARHADIAVIALKGAALHARGVYVAGERPMADIDLLIRGEDANALAEVLGECGYLASSMTRRHRAFKPKMAKPATVLRLGEHVDAPIKIEVHTRVAERLPVAVVDITDCIFPRTVHPGLNAYSCITSLMLHVLLHTAGNMRARALRLIQLNDIAALAGCFETSDWNDLVATRIDGQSLWWAFPPLALTARYYPSAIPTAVLDCVSADCPGLLLRRSRRQALTDVSWSNIRIEAFPGVEWSRSVLEALRFIGSRIMPNLEARTELKTGAEQIPGSSIIGWYESSHSRRILRWIFTRPPRVQTMLSVRAALAVTWTR